MSVIDEVKQRTDIVAVVSRYAVLSKAGRIFKGLCPFHSEKHASFFVYPEQQSWHCFGACNTGGDVFSFIMKQQDISFGEALRRLAEEAGVTIPLRAGEGKEKEKNERLYQTNEAAAGYFHHLLLNSPAGEKTRDYIARRGLSAQTIAGFQLGFSLNSWDSLKQHLMERGYSENELITAGLVIEGEAGKNSHDRFRNRLMFPIFDARGRISGFGARALDDSLPKYTNSPQTPVFDKSGILYGLNLAREAIKQQDQAVIVEGYFDVITAHQNGISNVVASMGVAVTEKHINILKRLTRNVIFALDSDAAGEEAMLRCVGYENLLDSEIRVLILPRGKDPDDVIKEDKALWQKLLAEASPIVDYTIDMVTAGLDLAKAKDTSLAASKLLPIIDEVKDVVRQAHYLQKLSRLVNKDERTLEAAMIDIRMRGRKALIEKPELKRAPQLLLSSPLEDYCLTLLLQHPELRAYHSQLLPDYFENSENREIFVALKGSEDISSVKDRLDDTIWEHFDRLMKKELPPDSIEPKLASCILRLRERYLRGLEIKREAILASEAASKGSDAELNKLKEQGIEVSTQLREVFRQRSVRGHKRGGVHGTG
jgi:DNA primase